MREAFFILLVILLIAALTVYRYRHQVGAVYQFWKVLKKAREQSRTAQGEIAASESVKGPLVNCAKCGTWVPESASIKLGDRIYFCSAKCVESTAKPA